MAKPSHIPKFGNWDANDPMPYTVVFDNARVGKGKITNPNDPAQYDALFEDGPDDNVVNSAASVESAPRPPARHQRRASRDDSEYGFNSRHAHNASAGEENSLGQTEDGSNHERAGSGSGFSPLHPQAYGGRLGRKPGSASPVVDRKSDRGAPGTPNRSRPERHVSPLPKFGEWDVNNPSADGYTVIFEKARTEKKAGGPLQVQDSPLQRGQDAPKAQPEGHERSNWFCRCFHPRTA